MEQKKQAERAPKKRQKPESNDNDNDNDDDEVVAMKLGAEEGDEGAAAPTKRSRRCEELHGLAHVATRSSTEHEAGTWPSAAALL